MNNTLYRNRKSRVLEGVCAGFADYFNIHVSLVRIVYVLGTLATGFFPGLILYIVLAMVLPVNSDPDSGGGSASSIYVPAPGAGRRVTLFIGLGLILLGAYSIIRMLLPSIYLRAFWPVVLILLGLSVVLAAARRN